MNLFARWTACGLTLSLCSLLPAQIGGVTFTDVAVDPSSGLTYGRVPSTTEAIFEALKMQPVYTMNDVVQTPLKSRGAPGVVLFDHDGDGDLDLYVTNGPGVANSLFSNQHRETGVLSFVDVGAQSGAGAASHDSTGACAGDMDNDGDMDLYVLGRSEPNLLFENQGAGTFSDITSTAGVGGGNRSATSCSMGDVNGDGLLDIVVGNTYTDWSHQIPIFVEPFAFNEHNQLFLNTGNNQFADVSASSGLENTRGFGPGLDGSPTITWAIAMVDYDLDGDIDILHADDQAAIPMAKNGGVDRGYIHVFQNDGNGFFADVTPQVGMDQAGQWMGLSFGDLNHDGLMDVFGSNVGDYMQSILPVPYALGDSTSRWFLGQPGGAFADPGVGSLVATPFGWGSAMIDYDNDGHTDILFHGGLDVGPYVDASNPGVLLHNDGGAQFELDALALAGGTNHQRRNVHGVATGDLNCDGFVDLVSVSNSDAPEPVPVVPYPAVYGSVFDPPIASFVPTFIPTGPGTFVFSGIQLPNGTLSVEVNSGGNRNRSITVDVLGTMGITGGGEVNRSGVGAVVTVTPLGGVPSMRPVMAGSSYASQDSLGGVFGLGRKPLARIDVLWPGGTRNRLYGVVSGEKIVFPEIPCSIDETNFPAYVRCLRRSLRELQRAGVLSKVQSRRFAASAVAAFFDR